MLVILLLYVRARWAHGAGWLLNWAALLTLTWADVARAIFA